MQPDSMDPASWIGKQIGNYRLTRVLGRGGMGMVFEGIHDGVMGRAAIKILRPDVSRHSDTTARFFNEARAANAILHPGIVRIFDCGVSDSDVAYLTMEFLEGESLRSRLAKYHTIPTKTALRTARQIASALAAAHAKQIIHRDIKPDNAPAVVRVAKTSQPLRAGRTEVGRISKPRRQWVFIHARFGFGKRSEYDRHDERCCVLNRMQAKEFPDGRRQLESAIVAGLTEEWRTYGYRKMV